MSKLTNCQIRELLVGLCRAKDSAIARGDLSAVIRKQRLIEKYEAELEQREAAGENPCATEIQESHIGRRAE